MFPFCFDEWLFSYQKSKEANNFPLITKFLFYSISIWALLTITHLIPFKVSSLIDAFIPFIAKNGNWFVTFYILLLFIVPYLNKFLTSLDKKTFQKFNLTLLLIWSIIPTLTNYKWSFSNIDFFLVMYSIGAYLRLHVHQKVSYQNYWNLIVGILSSVLIIASVFVCFYLSAHYQTNIFINNVRYFANYSSILAVIFAISWFLFFSNLNFHNRFINFVASSMIGVYLIHDNVFLRKIIWEGIYPNKLYLANPYLHCLIKVSLVFLICTLIDIIFRLTIFKFGKKTRM